MDSNSGILSENTKANYTERYDSLLKMKNHVNKYTYQYHNKSFHTTTYSLALLFIH